MARETWVQSQVESYQRLKKWYLTLSIIRFGSRVKWSNPGKGVAPSPTPGCSSYRKASLRVTLDYGRQLYFLLLFKPCYWLIDQVGRVFANGPGDLGSIPGHIIPKTLKVVLDTSLLSTQRYKIRIRGKVVQSRERSSALLYILV